MASNTSNLNLLKKDPLADGKDTFNIRTMLNENWDKIDEFAGKTTPISRGGTGATTAEQALANLGGIAAGAVGNLHVWKRVQTYSEPVPEVPAGYTLGEVETDVQLFTATSSKDNNRFCNAYYSKTLAVSNDGTVALANESTAVMYANTSGDNSRFAGTFVKLFGSSYSHSFIDYLFYIPEDSVLTAEQTTDSSNWKLTASKIQRVTGYPYTPAIPAGTTTDYLTSTDRNAYPDNVTDAQDAYYTLGDTVTGEFIISTLANPTVDYKYHVSSSVVVSEDGTVHLSGDYITVNFSNGHAPTKSDFAGKFVQYYGRSSSGETDSPPDTNPPFNSTPSQIVYVPNDVNIIITTPSYIDRYQPVTGHAAIPANTTITYLGQLGGGARIEVGSYVGTGTYGSSSPTEIFVGEKAKVFIMISVTYSSGYRDNAEFGDTTYKIFLPDFAGNSYHDVFNSAAAHLKFKNGIIYVYGSSEEYQANVDGGTYYYLVIY